MPPEESQSPDDWVRIAEKDLMRVSVLLGHEDNEAAGFYLQQAVEKFIKAYLLAQGWRLIRIHDLESLLSYAIEYDSSFAVYMDCCQTISGFYFMERYPLLLEESLSEADIRSALTDAERLVAKIRGKLSKDQL